MRGPLLEILERGNPGHPAIETPGATVSVGRLCELARAERAAARLGGAAPMICSRELVSFVVRILAFDGVVKAFHITSAASEIPADWPTLSAGRFAGGRVPGTETVWVLATSGTTGTPKLIEHTLDSLTATTKSARSGAPVPRWGLLYDPARFAGLQVVLQSLLGGGTLVASGLDDLEGALRFFRARGVSSLSGTPSYWRKILMTSAGQDLELRQITLGGEIADQPLLDALAQQFPASAIRHIYASTEAGVGFSVGDGRAGFPAGGLEDSDRLGGGLRVDRESHLLVRRAGTTAVGLQEMTPDGFLDTLDVVEQVGDRIHFLGRENGTINVGGNKVHPEMIEQVLCSHAEVAAARVFGKPNPIMGNLVMAEILPKSAASATLLDEVKSLCKSRLLPWQRPVTIRTVASLSVNNSGKLGRRHE